MSASIINAGPAARDALATGSAQQQKTETQGFETAKASFQLKTRLTLAGKITAGLAAAAQASAVSADRQAGFGRRFAALASSMAPNATALAANATSNMTVSGAAAGISAGVGPGSVNCAQVAGIGQCGPVEGPEQITVGWILSEIQQLETDQSTVEKPAVNELAPTELASSLSSLYANVRIPGVPVNPLQGGVLGAAAAAASAGIGIGGAGRGFVPGASGGRLEILAPQLQPEAQLIQEIGDWAEGELQQAYNNQGYTVVDLGSRINQPAAVGGVGGVAAAIANAAAPLASVGPNASVAVQATGNNTAEPNGGVGSINATAVAVTAEVPNLARQAVLSIAFSDASRNQPLSLQTVPGAILVNGRVAVQLLPGVALINGFGDREVPNAVTPLSP